ncbi:hypothetical protein SKAU_G00054500 [Synaphobranchus kaupii]|uniref:Uncharacterized protein n=1 Tax=Synaphobranchus kaupii TaxID=118154 RepID=A0A9Q1G538_SYNKA|nr:hypothetical protein SKAU_G00054500 [Synaphobranchus kaupii]
MEHLVINGFTSTPPQMKLSTLLAPQTSLDGLVSQVALPFPAGGSDVSCLFPLTLGPQPAAGRSNQPTTAPWPGVNKGGGPDQFCGNNDRGRACSLLNQGSGARGQAGLDTRARALG